MPTPYIGIPALLQIIGRQTVELEWLRERVVTLERDLSARNTNLSEVPSGQPG